MGILNLPLPPLLIQGLAKFVEWSANMMEEDAKRQLKTAELQAKKSRLRMWTNYVPPATNSKAIHDQNFTGKVAVGPLLLSSNPSNFVEISSQLHLCFC
jgi:hypothetical protein